MSTTESRSKWVTFRLTPTLKEKLQRESIEKEVPVSELVYLKLTKGN